MVKTICALVEVDVLVSVKVQKTPKHTFILTIPKKEVAVPLKLRGVEKAKVFLDKEKKRIIYEIQRPPRRKSFTSIEDR